MAFFLQQIKPIQLTIIIVSLIFLVLSSSVGVTKAILCIDKEKAHIFVKEDLHLSVCHSSSTDPSKESPFPISLLAEEETNQSSCIDIYLNSGFPSIFSHQVRTLLSKRSQDTLVFTGYPVLPENLNQVGLKTNPDTYPHTRTLAFLQTVVLLI